MPSPLHHHYGLLLLLVLRLLLPVPVQFLMVKEMFRLARVSQQDRKLPGFRLQQWYFFFVATFYLYLR